MYLKRNIIFKRIIGIFILFVLFQCNKSDDPLFDSYKNSDLEQEIDYKAISKIGSNIEKALKNADLTSIDEMLSEETKLLYSENNYSYTDEELETISKAFKKRKLVYATEDFAEFKYKIEGEEYALTIGQIEEGTWQIIRY